MQKGGVSMEDSYSWISPSLGPDERILWRGKPVRIRLFEAKDLYMIPFSLLWAGFAVYWEFSAIQSGAPFFFRLFGAFFVIVGLYITVGRFIYKSYILKRTSYAVTNERILINRNGKIDVLSKSALPSYTITRREDGSGTIRFHTSRAAYGIRAFSRPYYDYDPIRIIEVENVDQVLRLIQQKD